MSELPVLAEAIFDISGRAGGMTVKVHKPTWSPEKKAWGCQIEIGSPIDISRIIYGENSLQALVLALRGLSAYLYGSDLYGTKKIGIFGKFGGDLVVPATKDFLDIAPYAF